MILLLLAALQDGFTVDAAQKEIRVPCKVAPRKLPNLPEIYPLEVAATYPAPRGQKAHETAINIEVTPSKVHRALEGFGLKPGKPARGEGTAAAGPELELLLELPAAGGAPARRVPLESVLVDRRTARPLPPLKWRFTGSVLSQPDPNKPDKVYAADMTGTLVGIFPVTDETVIQSSLTTAEEPLVKLETDKALLPAEGTALTLVIRPARGGAAPAAARASVSPALLDELRLLGQSSGMVTGPPAFRPQAPVAYAPLPSADPFAYRRGARASGFPDVPTRLAAPALPATLP